MRTADSTTIIDEPGDVSEHVRGAWADDATQRVVTRAHFDDFLIRGMSPIYYVRMDLEWDYPNRTVAENGGLPRRTPSTPLFGPATALPRALRRLLWAQYPAFNYIR